MRHVIIATLIFGMTSAAFAQEDPSTKTLDEKLSQPAISGEWSQSTPKMREAKPIATAPGGEWPADPALNARKPMKTAQAVMTEPAATTTTTTTTRTIEAVPAPVQPAPVRQPVVVRQTTSPQGEIIDSQGAGAIPSLPLEVQSNGSVKWVTGGIGDEETAQLKSIQNQYNVRILMTAQQGEYISDVIVRLIAADGTVFATANNAGPYFYASVPPGKYTVEMTSRQAGIKKIDVNVPARGSVNQHLVFAE